jgi:hypothetical protein
MNVANPGAAGWLWVAIANHGHSRVAAPKGIAKVDDVSVSQPWSATAAHSHPPRSPFAPIPLTTQTLSGTATRPMSSCGASSTPGGLLDYLRLSPEVGDSCGEMRVTGWI